MKLFYVCVAWMAGVAIGSLISIPAAAFLASGILAFILALTFSDKWQLPLICAAALLLGAARYIAAQPAGGPSDLGTHIGETVTLDALLEEDASISGKGVRMRVGEIRLHASDGTIQPLEGMALVEFSRPPDGWRPLFGDAVSLRGRLDPPPAVDGFDYGAYLARQGIFAVLSDPLVDAVTPDQGGWVPSVLHAVRRHGLAAIAAIFPEPEASLLQGILLGDASGIPKEVSDAFARTCVITIKLVTENFKS